MVAYEAILETLKQQTFSVPWDVGLITTIAFFAWAFALAIGRRNALHPGILALLLLGATTIRYAQSIYSYHKGLNEGLWPIIWTCALVGGVALSRRERDAGPGP